MMKGRFSGFLSALILAVGSFFVLFLFFPDLSDRFFGVSMKNGNAVLPAETKKTPARTPDGLPDLDSLKNGTKKAVDNLMNTTVDKVVDKVSDKVNQKVTQRFSDMIKGNTSKTSAGDSGSAEQTQTSEEPKTRNSSVSERIDIKNLLK